MLNESVRETVVDLVAMTESVMSNASDGVSECAVVPKGLIETIAVAYAAALFVCQVIGTFVVAFSM